MNLSNPEQTLAMMQRVRNGKRRHFFFGIVGWLFGAYLYLNPSRHDLFFAVTTIKYFGAALEISYTVLVVFFGVCLFTRTWENICDRPIKRFQDKLTTTARQGAHF